MLSSVKSSAASERKLDLVFRALSDRTRRRLLSRLSEGSAMVTELAAPFDMSLPAVGKHLRVLEKAGLVQRTIDGRIHQCALDATPLKNANEWLSRYRKFWGETLDALDEYIRKNPDAGSRRKARK
jgi:DNA-binding transcriptional ArsR family regulator